MLSKHLNDPQFIARHRTKASAFVRDRRLPFRRLCIILIWNLRSALHLDLGRFFDQADNSEAPHPTAFSKARAFLKASAFVDLNDALIETARDQAIGDYRWHGLRLLAMDGSTLRMPKGSPEIAAHFGNVDCARGISPPLARMSYLYELRSNLIVAATITPYERSELTHAHDLLGERVWEEDCVIYDRGYNDPRIIAWSLAQDSHFVIRVAVRRYRNAEAFAKSSAQEESFDYHFSDEVIEEFKAYGIPLPKSRRLRFVRVELDTGEVEVLLTNLVDSREYPGEEFKALYHERWTVEEGIKTTKCKIEMENWTGKTVHSIYQDFHARVLSQNISVSLATVSQPALDCLKRNCRQRYKINVKRAIGLVRDHFVGLVAVTAESWKEIMDRVRRRLLRAASIVREERSFERGKPRRIPISQSYKPIT